MQVRSKSFAAVIAVLVSAYSSSSWAETAALPVPAEGRVPLTSTSPTHLRVNDDERQALLVATLALSSAWIGAVLDSYNRVRVKGFFADVWPDDDDDLDVDGLTALRRRWYLGGGSLWPIVETHRRVAAVCSTGEGTATVFVVGDKSIAAVDTALAMQPLFKGRALPLSMPVVSLHPLVDDDASTTLKRLTKGKPCVAVNHRDGAVNFDPETLSLTLPKREHRQRTRFPCTDAAGVVAAADRFVALMSASNRGTVNALPQPFAHPSIAMVSTGLAMFHLDDLRRVAGWLDPAESSSSSARRADAGLVLLERTDDGRPIQAEVRLRAGVTEAIVHLQIFDDTCRLNGVPFTWSPTTTKSGETVSTDELSAWRHVGDAWVPGPTPNIVNTRTAKK